MIEVRPPRPAERRALSAILEREQLDMDSNSIACWVAVERASDGAEQVVGGVIADLDYGDYGDDVPRDFEENHAFIHAIAVAQEHRRKGAGRQLLRQVAEAAEASRREFLVLMPQETFDSDAEHLVFFRSCGLASLTPGKTHLAPYGAPVAEILDYLRPRP